MVTTVGILLGIHGMLELVASFFPNSKENTAYNSAKGALGVLFGGLEIVGSYILVRGVR